MDADLRGRAEFSRQPMRIKISEQENGLKEQQADNPDPGGAAKPGQDHFPQDGLDLEQKERARKYHEPIDKLGTHTKGRTPVSRNFRFQDSTGR
jgi:hypothetical protein